MRLDIRVVPRSSRNIVEMRDGRVTVRVTAPPVDDAANDAVQAALADALDLPRRAIRIVMGQRTRNKTMEISGLDEAEVRRRIETARAKAR